MVIELPAGVSRKAIQELILAMADDELILGHRDSEWTGYAPILEEDIAFSNIAQDEIGHSLVWLTLYEQLGGNTPDAMAFERGWQDFRCCRFVSYPIGDFAYSVVRQYLFDAVEQVRLRAMLESSFVQFRDIAARILREEDYHLMHSQGLVERLGDATEESHRRMGAALDVAFPQALGIYERLTFEDELIDGKIFPGNPVLRDRWIQQVVPVLTKATLEVPGSTDNGAHAAQLRPEEGGRKGNHTEHLEQLVHDMQSVYRLFPGGKW